MNRALKEADGQRIYEATMQTGSYNDKRVSLDAGQVVNENVAVRFNAFYENSDTFRQYGHFERYGINPTVTLTPMGRQAWGDPARARPMLERLPLGRFAEAARRNGW